MKVQSQRMSVELSVVLVVLGRGSLLNSKSRNRTFCIEILVIDLFLKVFLRTNDNR